MPPTRPGPLTGGWGGNSKLITQNSNLRTTHRIEFSTC